MVCEYRSMSRISLILLVTSVIFVAPSLIHAETPTAETIVDYSNKRDFRVLDYGPEQFGSSELNIELEAHAGVTFKSNAAAKESIYYNTPLQSSDLRYSLSSGSATVDLDWELRMPLNIDWEGYTESVDLLRTIIDLLNAAGYANIDTDLLNMSKESSKPLAQLVGSNHVPLDIKDINGEVSWEIAPGLSVYAELNTDFLFDNDFTGIMTTNLGVNNADDDSPIPIRSLPDTLTITSQYSQQVTPSLTVSLTPGVGLEIFLWSLDGDFGTYPIDAGSLGPISLNADQTGSTKYYKLNIDAPGGYTSPTAGQYLYAPNVITTVTATVHPGHPGEFHDPPGWVGCNQITGTYNCSVTMSGPKTVTAEYDAYLSKHMLNVNIGGRGSVYSVDPQTGDANGPISCGVNPPCFSHQIMQLGSFCADNIFYLANISWATPCTADFTARPSTTTAYLQTKPAAGWYLSSYSTGPLGAAPAATGYSVDMSGYRDISFIFKPLYHVPLNVTKTGTGTVMSLSKQINCGSSCSGSYDPFDSDVLTAKAGVGYIFTGWSGCDRVSGDHCDVTMSGTAKEASPKSVTATFAPQATITVSRATGTISSTDGLINCGSAGTACSGAYAQGSTVMLHALPDSGWVFKNWTGCDSSTGGACKVTATSTKSVSAVFGRKLTVNIAGAGGVKSNVGGINCGAGSTHCNAIVSDGAIVTLSPSALVGAAFDGWSDQYCQPAGSDKCTLTMNGNKNVMASFVTNAFCLKRPMGLVNWWKGDGSAYDSAGISDGTLVNGGPDYVNGMVGHAFKLGGSGRVDFGSAAGNFGISDFSASFWIKYLRSDRALQLNQMTQPQLLLPGTSTSYTPSEIISKATGSDHLWRIEKNRANPLLANEVLQFDDNSTVIKSKTIISIDRYYHVGITRQGSALSIYIDGSLDTSVSDFTANLTSTDHLVLANSGGKLFELDDIQIYDRALGPSEVNAIYAAGIAGLCPPAQPAQTGQATCHDSAGSVLACTDTGQDGDTRMGTPWPAPRFKDNGDQTITDDLTGLIWAKDAKTPGPSVCTPGAVKTWQGSLDHVACLNANNYLGHADWRQPNILELRSLINRDQASVSAWLNLQGFTNAQSSTYWSSSPYVSSSGTTSWAWQISMLDGLKDGSTQWEGAASVNVNTNACYLWPVRGTGCGNACLPKTGMTTSYATGDDGALQEGIVWPNPRFTNPDGTSLVTAATGSVAVDQLTGLMWTQDGDAPGPVSCNPGVTMTWQAALDYVKCLNTNRYLGYSDWRLPNSDELKSLANPGQPNPTAWLTAQGFANGQSAYWSSTTYARNPGLAWIVDFKNNGNDKAIAKSGASLKNARPVRGGQFMAELLLIISKTGTGSGDVSADNGSLIWSGETGTAQYSPDTSVSLTAAAESGSTFSGWSGACTGTGTCTVTMFGRQSVKAIFAANAYTVTPTAGSNGTISPSEPQTLNYGETASFTVTPNSEYRTVSVAGCGGVLSANIYTTGPITGDCTITATFGAVGADGPIAVPDGDLDGGGVSVTDALKALRIAVGLDASTTAELAHGDVAPFVNAKPQPDGKIGIGDVVVILRRAVGLISW